MAIRTFPIGKGKYLISNNEGCVCKTLPYRFQGTFVCRVIRLAKIPGAGCGAAGPTAKYFRHEQKKEGCAMSGTPPMFIL